MIRILGRSIYVYFLVHGRNVLAYGWHYTSMKAMDHIRKITEFHELDGELVSGAEYEEWLEDMLEKVVYKGYQFRLPNRRYKYRAVYETLTRVRRGEVLTYSELASRSKVKYIDVLKALMRNPFQILVPCHRLITKSGGLMGFYPLGVDLKRELLKAEGVRIDI